MPLPGFAWSRAFAPLRAHHARILFDSKVPFAPAAAARRFNADSFPGAQPNAGLAGNRLFGTVSPNDHRSSRRAVISSGQAIWPAGTAVGEQCNLGIGQDLDLAHDSVATAVQARASAVGAKRILPQTNRIGVFKGLRGSVERVGHVSMNARHAIFSRTRTHAAGDSFVISKGLAGTRIHAADGQIVHGPGS